MTVPVLGHCGLDVALIRHPMMVYTRQMLDGVCAKSCEANGHGYTDVLIPVTYIQPHGSCVAWKNS